MDSFESEFEIPPTRIVEAMAQLDESQLAKSPEATADAVIDQLGLSDADADKASAMYAALLVQLSQMPQQQTPKVPEWSTGAGMSQQNMQTRIVNAQGKQDLLEASADRVNKKFLVTPELKATAMPSLDSVGMQQMTMDENSLASLSEMNSEAMEVPEGMDLPQMPPLLNREASKNCHRIYVGK